MCEMVIAGRRLARERSQFACEYKRPVSCLDPTLHSMIVATTLDDCHVSAYISDAFRRIAIFFSLSFVGSEFFPGLPALRDIPLLSAGGHGRSLVQRAATDVGPSSVVG